MKDTNKLSTITIEALLDREQRYYYSFRHHSHPTSASTNRDCHLDLDPNSTTTSLLSTKDNPSSSCCNGDDSGHNVTTATTKAESIALSLDTIYHFFCDGLAIPTSSSSSTPPSSMTSSKLKKIFPKNHHFANRTEVVSFMYQIIDYYKEDRQLVQIAMYYLDSFLGHLIFGNECDQNCSSYHYCSDDDKTEKNENNSESDDDYDDVSISLKTPLRRAWFFAKNENEMLLSEWWCEEVQGSCQVCQTIHSKIKETLHNAEKCINCTDQEEKQKKQIFSPTVTSNTTSTSSSSSSSTSNENNDVGANTNNLDRKRKVSPTTVMDAKLNDKDSDDQKVTEGCEQDPTSWQGTILFKFF